MLLVLWENNTCLYKGVNYDSLDGTGSKGASEG